MTDRPAFINIPSGYVVQLVQQIHEKLQDQNLLYDFRCKLDTLSVSDKNSSFLFASVPELIIVGKNFASQIRTDMNFSIVIIPSEMCYGEARFEGGYYDPKQDNKVYTTAPMKEIWQIKGKIWNLYQERNNKIGLLIHSLLSAKNIKS